jgi:ParB family chromosome partitioning protein
MKNSLSDHPHAIGVKKVATGTLHPNPHNPRMLFDQEPMDVLERSIDRTGILVPLSVYWEKARKRYVILDGQRRWMCAQKLGLKTVPISEVSEPSLVQNIVTMFQIHKFREDWQLMPTALKIELLIQETGEKDEDILAEMTGLAPAVIVRCKKLIYFDKEFQSMMLDGNPDLRVKADFFIELHSVIRDKDVRKFDWFKEKVFINQMLRKYQEEPRTIISVTSFRLIKQHLTNARKANAIDKLSGRLRKFAEDPAIDLSYLDISEINVHSDAQAMVKKVSDLTDLIRKMDEDRFYGEEDLWLALDELSKLVEDKLRKADKRR